MVAKGELCSPVPNGGEWWSRTKVSPKPRSRAYKRGALGSIQGQRVHFDRSYLDTQSGGLERSRCIWADLPFAWCCTTRPARGGKGQPFGVEFMLRSDARSHLCGVLLFSLCSRFHPSLGACFRSSNLWSFGSTKNSCYLSLSFATHGTFEDMEYKSSNSEFPIMTSGNLPKVFCYV